MNATYDPKLRSFRLEAANTEEEEVMMQIWADWHQDSGHPGVITQTFSLTRDVNGPGINLYRVVNK